MKTNPFLWVSNSSRATSSWGKRTFKNNFPRNIKIYQWSNSIHKIVTHILKQTKPNILTIELWAHFCLLSHLNSNRKRHYIWKKEKNDENSPEKQRTAEQSGGWHRRAREGASWTRLSLPRLGPGWECFWWLWKRVNLVAKCLMVIYGYSFLSLSVSKQWRSQNALKRMSPWQDGELSLAFFLLLSLSFFHHFYFVYCHLGRMVNLPLLSSAWSGPEEWSK